MLRYMSLLLILITAAGCGGSWFERERRIIQIQSTELSRVVITYSEKLLYEKHLDLEDSVVFYENKINRIRLDYSSMDILDVLESRALLVDVVEGFLSRVNGNALISADLAQSPMTASDLEVYIRFKSFYDCYIDLQTVGLITLKGGIATYFASDTFAKYDNVDVTDCETDCWHKRSEYYYQSKNFTEFKRQGEVLYKPKEERSENTIFQEHNPAP